MLLFIGMTIWGCREKKLTRRERLKWAYACLSLAFFTVLPSMKAFHFWTLLVLPNCAIFFFCERFKFQLRRIGFLAGNFCLGGVEDGFR